MFDGISYGAGIIGGFVLIAGTYTTSARVGPRWIRLALWLCGVAGLVWGLLGFALLMGFDDAQNTVGHFKTLFAGMAIGILVLLFASGEFDPLFTRKTK